METTKHLCVLQDFLTEDHQAQINTAAQQYGFTAHFFTSDRKADAIACVQNCEILYAQAPDVLRAAPASLKWYAASSAGADAYCKDPSVFANPDCLFTVANVYGVTIAEHVIMTTLMLLRRMPAYSVDIQNHIWSRPLPVRSIRDAAFTILGTGNIGQNIADRLHGMNAAFVTGLSRFGRPHPAFDAVLSIDKLDDILPDTQFLIMALPATPDTIHILNRARLALLPKTAYVINIGRGSAVEQDALIDALNHEEIAGAALDVTDPEPLPADHPLWNAKNLVLTPHVSGNMTLGYTADANVTLFCENLARYANGEPLQGLVDRSRGY